MSVFHGTAATFRQGARTLPGEYYTSPAIFASEQERIFARRWHCAGRASRIAQPGDYLVRTVAGESVIVVRGQDDVVRGFFNVCRHRGTRLCRDEAGRFASVIRCPYHAWTYAIDGRLLGAPHMQDVADFDRAEYSLQAAAIAVCEGFVFVALDPPSVPFVEACAPLVERLRRFDLGRLSIGHRADYDVRANWKLVFQNYSECLHCPVIHPELASRIPYESGANDLTEGPFLGGYMRIDEAHASVTVSGRACAPLITDRVTGADCRRAYYYSIMPNMLLGIHPDYVTYYVLTPLAPDRTRVESEWLFRSDAGGAFAPEDAVSLWETVNRQDWDIIEQSQLGVSSRRYVPGPYSPRESIAAAWDREYLRMMQAVVPADR